MTTFDTWDDVPKTREAKTVIDHDIDLSTQHKLLSAQKNLSYILKDARNDFAKLALTPTSLLAERLSTMSIWF